MQDDIIKDTAEEDTALLNTVHRHMELQPTEHLLVLPADTALRHMALLRPVLLLEGCTVFPRDLREATVLRLFMGGMGMLESDSEEGMLMVLRIGVTALLHLVRRLCSMIRGLHMAPGTSSFTPIPVRN